MKKYLLLLVILFNEILTVKKDNTGCHKINDLDSFKDLIELEPDMSEYINIEEEYYDEVGIYETDVIADKILTDKNFDFDVISVDDFEKCKKEKGEGYLFCIIYPQFKDLDQKVKIFFNVPIENYDENKESINDCKPFKKMPINYDFISYLIENKEFQDNDKLISRNIDPQQISNLQNDEILRIKKMNNYHDCFIFVSQNKKMVFFSFKENLNKRII